MILYRFQVLTEEKTLPSDKGWIGLDFILEAKDIEHTVELYTGSTFKVTTLMDEEAILKRWILMDRSKLSWNR